MRAFRKGFTLVEVGVALAISTVLFLVLWDLFASGVRQWTLTQRHLEAVQVAQLVLEQIESDLHGMVPLEGATPFDAPEPRASLSLLVSRTDREPGGVYQAAPVRYELEPFGPGASCLKRNGTVLRHLPLRSLEFKPLVHPALDGTPESPRDLYLLQVTVTALDSSCRQEFTLVGLVAADLLTARRACPQWNPTGLQVVRRVVAP